MEGKEPENLNFGPVALKILHEKYLWRDEQGRLIETPEQMLHRVARVVSKGNRQDEEQFFRVMADLEFLPNSPTLMNAGREGAHGQLAGCFVLDVPDNMEGIFDSLKNTALIHKSGGGTGFNFSTLRPKGSPVRSTNGIASGVVSFMSLFDRVTETVLQGGMRRGANMGILSIDHPDIEEFITAKDTEGQGRLSNFNLSVGVTDEFMHRLYEGEPQAVHLWGLIVGQAWRTGDPGVIFLDTLEEGNTTPHLGRLEATNPCGESPLYPYEACNLGSINLASFYRNGKFEWFRLDVVIETAVKFLDNVIDANHYPLEIIAHNVRRTRKIGLGVMGFADLLYKMGISYKSRHAQKFGHDLMEFVQDTARQASERLAEQKGAFAAYDAEAVNYSPRRNATLTCIAPTGTISLLAGCSSGIEPVFALSHRRRITNKDGSAEEITVYHPEYEKARADRDDPRYYSEVFVTAHEVTPEEHVLMQAAFQKHTDLAVSKTINLPHDATPQDISDAYRLAWRQECKGVTIYRDGSKDVQILTPIKPDAADEKPLVCECGEPLTPKDGCYVCEACGWSPCSI